MMMNFKGLSDDVEIRTVSKTVTNVEDIVKSYNLKMAEQAANHVGNDDDEEEDDDDECDITVPIIEMTYDDSDEQDDEVSKGENKTEMDKKKLMEKAKLEINGEDEGNS